MKRWINTVLLCLPLAAGIWCLHAASGMLFGRGLWSLLGFISDEARGGQWVAIGAIGFVAFILLVASGAFLSLTWDRVRMRGGEVREYVGLGGDLSGYEFFAAADDSDGDIVKIFVLGHRDLPTSGFDLVYRRQLLVRTGTGPNDWDRLSDLSLPALIWPIMVLPISFMFGLAAAITPIMIAYELKVPVVEAMTTELVMLGLPLVLFANIGIWALLVSLLAAVALLPLVILTGRWQNKARGKFHRPDDPPGNPQLISLPENIAIGAKIQGRVVARSGAWRDGTNGRRALVSYVLKFDDPFRPPVWVGFSFYLTRKLKNIHKYLEEQFEKSGDITVEVQAGYDLAILPVDPESGAVSETLKKEIL